jgi:anaerobic selenocysteine-containing dehydrogenase
VGRTVPSFCRVCNNECPILVEVDDDGRAVRVTGDPANPVHQGYSCSKGRTLPERLAHPERLHHSLKRLDDGTFVPIPLHDAVGEIAERLTGILDRHGPRAIAGYFGTYQAASVMTSPLTTAFMDAIGSPMRFTPMTIDKPGKPIARALHGSWMAPPQGFDEPDVALLIGVNPFVSYQGFPYGNPGKWLAEQRERGMDLIVIDPRRSDVAKRAQLHLQIRPGQDIPVLACMIREILARGLEDREFLAEEVDGLEALRAAVEPFDPGYVSRRADVPAEDLVRAAHLWGEARRGYGMAGTGPSMSSGHCTLAEYLLLCLETICGHWLRAGERVRNPRTLMPGITPKAQAAGPTPGYGFGEQLRVRGMTDTVAGLPCTAMCDEILMEGEGQIRALLSCGGNPVAAFPDVDKTTGALRSLDLLVQIDPWMSHTAQVADYVIAPTMCLEVPSVAMMGDFAAARFAGRGAVDAVGQYSPAVAATPEGSDLVEEWQFFYLLAQAMGLELRLDTILFSKVDGVALDMAEPPTSDELIELLVRGSRIPLDEVKQHPHGAVFSEPAVHVAPKDPGWASRLDVANADMLRDLAEVLAHDPTEVVGTGAFRLICRRATHAMNSSVNHDTANRGRRYNPAFMHPDDLAELDLVAGDRVEITSAAGAIPAIVQPDATLRRGLVSMAHSYGPLPGVEQPVEEAGANTNVLVFDDLGTERYSGMPRMSNVPVDVHPVRAGRPVRLSG